MASAPLNKIDTAHQMYKDGKYEQALGFYADALSMAKTKLQKIALHSNRAACFLKLHDFKNAAEECTSVLELDHDHAGALMLRAQTLVTVNEYHSALFDVNRLLELNPSAEIYRNLEARLRTQLGKNFLLARLLLNEGKSLAPIPESEAELEEEEEKAEAELYRHEEELQDGEDAAMAIARTNQQKDPFIATVTTDVVVPKIPTINWSSEIRKDLIFEPRKTIAAEVIAQAQRKVKPRKTLAAEVIARAQRKKELSDQLSKGWQAIPKPKGHSALNYDRWDKVEDDSSEDEDDEDEDEKSQPQYRFRLRTVGVQSAK